MGNWLPSEDAVVGLTWCIERRRRYVDVAREKPMRHDGGESAWQRPGKLQVPPVPREASQARPADRGPGGAGHAKQCAPARDSNV